MFGAIYIGLSGLNAYSRGLQLVGNNVSNLNSVGYKSTSVSFTDLVNETGRGGFSYSGDGATLGGGVAVDDSRRNFAPGELRQTNRDLDLAVEGKGFLVLMRGDQLFYTRTGSFEVNPDGFIVLAGTDYRLATLDSSGRPVTLSVDSSRTSPPEKTTKIEVGGNLSSTATTNPALGDIRVFDQTGAEHVWRVEFSRPTGGAAGEWAVTVTDDKGKTIGPKTLKFNQAAADPATSKLVFEDADSGLSVTLDMSQVTSFSAGPISTLRVADVDGRATGTNPVVSVNDEGQLEMAYSNEEKEQLGAVALADFRNPQALEQRGGGLFVDNKHLTHSFLTSADLDVGRVVARRLEASNVDLAQQFGDLILIQRGFQASSQIISVSNDMIQQLFGIRGQG